MRLALAAALIAASSAASAGTCHVFQDGENTVEDCGTGFTVTDRHGHTRTYGHPNGGFEYYPGQPQPPMYEEQRK